MPNNDPIEFDLSELKEYARRFPTIVDAALELVALELNRNMKLEAPVDTGYLKGSIELPVRLRALVYAIAIGAAYWRPVQFGILEPYDIVPKTAKALAFEWKGEFVFFKRVTIPTREGNPFIDRAIETTEPKIPDFVSIAIARAA